mmetsp:Transcript_25827/g.24660  ORF Transcript_25827/g.24660 Transcript_25827/m.24660 type:complete len:214 (-) Transcript_25827:142-783(-)|eukprot:CAMPEP_0119043890 /NCGR_PEP_ID=MMETSP1177-20130426/26618_1 /TAXON_ID=2985 /ORGANISM="Ochromonas sp, Strain CCMP1899" /LENGTH=213 /DNA_ID=CAMNT_0007012953 /DNA_START=90 /DNA_END=731 /DNA_ORIENTATION=-
MSAWGKNTVQPTVVPISFKHIIEQQSVLPVDAAEDIAPAVDTDNLTTNDCSNDNNLTTTDDFKLAQLLQQLENEELSSSNHKHPDQNKFSKISVVSRYESSSSTRNNYQGSQIKSSDYKEAMHRESQLNPFIVDSKNTNMFKGGCTMLPDCTFITKHDKLLNGLSNSVKLTEIEGVGDLSGAGFLIGNSVANSFRSSAANLERISSQKKRNKE